MVRRVYTDEIIQWVVSTLDTYISLRALRRSSLFSFRLEWGKGMGFETMESTSNKQIGHLECITQFSRKVESRKE